MNKGHKQYIHQPPIICKRRFSFACFVLFFFSERFHFCGVFLTAVGHLLEFILLLPVLLSLLVVLNNYSSLLCCYILWTDYGPAFVDDYSFSSSVRIILFNSYVFSFNTSLFLVQAQFLKRLLVINRVFSASSCMAWRSRDFANT